MRFEPDDAEDERRALDPVVARLLRASATPPHLDDLPPEQARTALREVQGTPPEHDDVAVTFAVAPVGPGGLVGYHEFRPSRRNRSRDGALVLHVHGGRWLAGDGATHARLARRLARSSGATVIVPEHSRAPESRFPVALEECYALLERLTRTPRPGFDPDRVAISGDGTGATIATAVALLARRRRGPRLRAQLLYYPLTDPSAATASHQRFSEGFLLSSDGSRRCWERYLGSVDDRRDPLAVPSRAGYEDLVGSPPTLVVTAAADVTRDEAERYAARLRAAGTPTAVRRYAGTVHDFVSLHSLQSTPASRAAVRLGGGFLRRALT